MLVAYFDESGQDADSPTFWLGGFLADAATWFEVTRLWERALRDASVHALHMVDLAHRKREFRDWSEAQRQALLEELIGILTSHDVVGIGAGVEKASYQRHIIDSGFLRGSRLTQGWWKTPFLIPFQDCLVECLEASRSLPKSETLSVILEQQPEFSNRAREVFQQLRDFPRDPGRNRFASISFRSKYEAVPLQAADLLVYELRKGYNRSITDPAWPMRASLKRLATRLRSSRIHDDGTLCYFVESYEEAFPESPPAT